jgi:hypothetical protein
MEFLGPVLEFGHSHAGFMPAYYFFVEEKT